MSHYWHSVTLDKDKCKGCTNCIKLCPTQAIRVRDGKARIIKERCIDCGVCIRVCPYHAKRAVMDGFDKLDKFKYNIALPAPSFYGQFPKAGSIDVILTGLKLIGFDDVYEVAAGAQMVTEAGQRLLARGGMPHPVISSACPAVVRLILVRFPNLIGNIAPLRSPMEVAATLARREAVSKTGLSEKEIGIFFISPCAAKATDVKAPVGIKKSQVDGVISIKDTYLRLAHKIGKIEDVQPLSTAGGAGVLWANSGGESSLLETDKHIAVNGIANVIRVFEDMEDGKLLDIDFVEALACTCGCVGGPLTVENNFVAQTRVRRLAKKAGERAPEFCADTNMLLDKELIYRPIMNLDEDMERALTKLQLIDEVYAALPQLDCGACGSPSCRTFAEDVVGGFASIDDCIFEKEGNYKKPRPGK